MKLPAFFRKRKKTTSSTSGQALLIILLIMAVGLTIGLSITSRSITDIKISELSEEGARAFSAAEAGVEEALLAGEGTFESPPEWEASYQTLSVGFGEGDKFVFPQELSLNTIQTLYLAQYETDGTLTPYYSAGTIDVCWEGSAALEVGIYYQEAGVYKVARAAIDPDGTRRDDNNFDPPDGGSCAGLDNKKGLSLPGGTPLFLRLRVLYANAKVGVRAPGGTGGLLPSQGIEIESTGYAGEATRKVKIVKFHPAPPVFFDMLLYSQGELGK